MQNKYPTRKNPPLMNSKMPTSGWAIQGESLLQHWSNATKTLGPQNLHLFHQVFWNSYNCCKFPFFCPQMRHLNKFRLMWISIDWTQWKKQVCSLLGNGWEGSPNGPNTIYTTFQFAWALFAMNPLNCGIWTPFAFMTLTRAFHIRTRDSTSSNCMSHIATIMIFNIVWVIDMACHGNPT
jgi:hypothetical protein